jgi:site-specific DNA-methyltransferase (adenine-specific)
MGQRLIVYDFFSGTGSSTQAFEDAGHTIIKVELDEYFEAHERDILQLTANWYGRVWCNPPYGRVIKDWVKKASEHNDLVVMLLPSRTDTKWFHELVLPYAEVQFIKGRLKFGGSKLGAPFPSIIVTYTHPVDK